MAITSEDKFQGSSEANCSLFLLFSHFFKRENSPFLYSLLLCVCLSMCVSCMLAVWCSDSHDFPSPSPRQTLFCGGKGWFNSSQPWALQHSWQACLPVYGKCMSTGACVCVCSVHGVEMWCIKLKHMTRAPLQSGQTLFVCIICINRYISNKRCHVSSPIRLSGRE